MGETVLGVVAFTAIVLVLSLLVLAARRLLVPAGECGITINDRDTVSAPVGQKLLGILDDAGIHLPSACGGAGTCGLCKVRVLSGGGEPMPQETALLSRQETRGGTRLACQVSALHPMKVVVDDVYLSVQTWQCTVESVDSLATLIREIVIRLPQGETLDCPAGSFVQVTCPPYRLDFGDIELDPAMRDNWRSQGLLSLKAGATRAETRAYSMANHPGENDRIRLNIRVAVPPPGTRGIAPGIVSSWLFSLRPGDTISVSGPYGLFFVGDSERELVFIGGGVGMAPLYAQIRDLLETRRSRRPISYWYGARSAKEVYYADVFEDLAQRFENFSWHPALSDPDPGDQWRGHTGFIHEVVLNEYLSGHRAPEDCEYYLCGPPLMIKAVRGMLDNLGVDPADIHFDDFGG